MRNWSTDEEKLKQGNKQKYNLWQLVQQINYGLDEGERLNREEVKTSWSQIKDKLDPYKARLIEYLVWGKRYSLPPNLTFYNWPPLSQK